MAMTEHWWRKNPELPAAMQWLIKFEIQCKHSDDPSFQEMLRDQKQKVCNLH